MKKIFLLFALTFVCSIAFAQNSNEKSAEKPTLKEFEGVFKFKETFQQVKFEYKNGDLYAEVDQNGQNKLLVLPETDKFKSTSSYGSIFTFKRDADKKIIGVKIEIMGNELEAQKE
jgi:hypothetical protein